MRASLREVREGDEERLEDVDEAIEFFAGVDSPALSLEKAWDGLHHLLEAAGEAPELGFLLVGGREVGADLSYGPPRLFDARFVKRLDAALKEITDDQLWAGFDAEQFEADGVYPGIWDEPPEELREEYISYFHQLQEFVSQVAASNGEFALVID